MSSHSARYDAIVATWKAGDADTALAQMSELIAAHPEEALPYAALSAWYKAKGQIDDAIAYAEKYCEKAPDDPFGFSILSALRLMVGLRLEAEEALMKARDIRLAEHLRIKAEADESEP